MKVLLIDNYDSFTYNVVHLLRECGVSDITVLRNDELNLEELSKFTAVIASPGPGLPKESGELLAAISACLKQEIPYLGICLGHQALGEVVGAKLERLEQVQHGVVHSCTVNTSHPLLVGVASTGFDIGRYHSWIISRNDMPDEIQVLASTDDEVIQAIALKNHPAYGLQFHPESIMSAKAGRVLMTNFLTLASQFHAQHS